MPADLAAVATDVLRSEDDRLQPVTTSPTISASEAIEIAGRELLEYLRSNRLPEQDPGVPDGLVRIHYVSASLKLATDVWLVAYRWKARWDCGHPQAHRPGPCQMGQFVLVDDRTGKIIQGFVVTLHAPSS